MRSPRVFFSSLYLNLFLPVVRCHFGVGNSSLVHLLRTSQLAVRLHKCAATPVCDTGRFLTTADLESLSAGLKSTGERQRFVQRWFVTESYQSRCSHILHSNSAMTVTSDLRRVVMVRTLFGLYAEIHLIREIRWFSNNSNQNRVFGASTIWKVQQACPLE